MTPRKIWLLCETILAEAGAPALRPATGGGRTHVSVPAGWRSDTGSTGEQYEDMD